MQNKIRVVLLLEIIVANCDIVDNKISVSDITDALIDMLRVNTETPRFVELKAKLNRSAEHLIDKDKYEELLKNLTLDTNLNETNFYKSIQEKDHFQFLLVNESKNLYLQLKERMNRDDILRILSERGENERIVKSARRMMEPDRHRKISNEDEFDNVIDKLLGETPEDDHKCEFRKEDDKYWDPQKELEDWIEHHKPDGRRIYRGERTTVRNYPFMVSVHVMSRFWCGGVVYWSDLVLTSAACLQLMHNNRFYRENPNVLAVRVGSNHSRIGGEVVEALEVYFHPSYNPRTLRNNIAIIRLMRHLHFNYHRIPKVIDISHSRHPLAPTSEVLLLGWGVLKTSQRLAYEPVFLNKKLLPVYPNVFCKEVYGEKFVSETNFCAGTVTTGEGACSHDAGGPAILSGRLVGIISFAPAVCGFPNSPTVFTLVGAYADWIETIRDTMPGYYRGKKNTTTTNAFGWYQNRLQRLEQLTASRELLTWPSSPTTTSSPEPTTTPPPGLRGAAFRGRDREDYDGWSLDMD